MSPLARACRDFAITFAVAVVAMVLLVRLMQSAGMEAGGFASIVPVLAGTFFAGSRFAEREGRVPESGLSWRVAIWATVAAAAIAAAILVLMVLIEGETAWAELRLVAAKPGLLALVLGVLAAVHVLTIRFVFPFAARITRRE